MSTLGKLIAKVFVALLIVAFACIIVNWLICSKRPDIGSLLSFIPDITAPDSPTSVTIIKGGVSIP